MYHQKMQKYKLKRRRRPESTNKTLDNSPSKESTIKLDKSLTKNAKNQISKNDLRKLVNNEQLKNFAHQSLTLDGTSIDGSFVDKITSLGIPIQ